MMLCRTYAALDTTAIRRSLRQVAGQEAAAILGEVVDATSGWRRAAGDVGLSGGEIERMARAFEHDEAVRAREVVASTF